MIKRGYIFTATKRKLEAGTLVFLLILLSFGFAAADTVPVGGTTGMNDSCVHSADVCVPDASPGILDANAVHAPDDDTPEPSSQTVTITPSVMVNVIQEVPTPRQIPSPTIVPATASFNTFESPFTQVPADTAGTDMRTNPVLPHTPRLLVPPAPISGDETGTAVIAPPAGDVVPDGISTKYPLMHFTRSQLDEFSKNTRTSPKFALEGSGLPLPAGSADLLPYLAYTPSERDQGYCGNCWVWAATGALEVDHTVKTGVNDRLSVQYFNSKYNNGQGSGSACCGGWIGTFTGWYSSDKRPIPWSNSNADFGDYYTSCGSPTAVLYSTISPYPHYQLSSLTSSDLSTYGVGQTNAINAIKTQLNANKSVVYSFFYGDSGWSDFTTFWSTGDETWIFNPDPHAGETQTGGHSVLIVGYNDTDPFQPYWIVLNSWGAPGGRPNGLFRLNMSMNYDALAYYAESSSLQQHTFQILDSSYDPGPYAPIVTSVTPGYGSNTASISITDLAGNDFVPGAAVELYRGGDASPLHRGSITDGTGGALLNSPRSVFVSGNYAYIASTTSNALEIVDVTDPAGPVHAGSLATADGGALLTGPMSVFVSGNYAYVASWGNSALEIVDVTDPAHPVHKGSLSNGVDGALLLYPDNVYVSGNHAYVTSMGSNSLEIVNVTDPANPVHEGSITNGTGGALLSGPWSVFVSGNYAYVASADSNALEIVNVTDPAHPAHEGSITNGTGGAVLSGPWGVYVSGNYAYVASTGSSALEIVDVTDPAHPAHKGSLSNGIGGSLLSSPVSVFVDGDTAYVAGFWSNAIEVVDVSEPANPLHKGSLTDGAGGALLTNPFGISVSGNNIYVASWGSNALEIVDPGFTPVTTLPVSDVTVVSPDRITCTFDLTGQPTGSYHVKVSNPDGQKGTLVNGFTVLGPGPTISGITPDTGMNTTSMVITDLAGTNFAPGAGVELNRTGITGPFHTGSIGSGPGGVRLYSPESVFVSGNYAYVVSVDSESLDIVDVTDPANPVYAGSLTNGEGGAVLHGPHGIFVSGEYAYITNYYRDTDTLEIVNVSDPANPVPAGKIVNGDGGALLKYPFGVSVSGHYAYVGSAGSDALEILDVTDPAHPVHAGSISNGEGGALLDGASTVVVSGNYAYVTSWNNNALEIVDVTDPAHPVHTGSIYHGQGGAQMSYPQSVFKSGNYAYVASNSNALEIVDVSDPANPVHKGIITNGEGGALLDTPRSVYVSGDSAYVASQFSHALEIIDVSDRADPVHKSSVINGAGGAGLNGPYSVFVSGNNAYVANNFGSTLEIIDLGPLPASGVTVVSPERITCTFNLTGVSSGRYTVVVSNPDRQQAMLMEGFTVTSPPGQVRSNIGVFRPAVQKFILKNGTETTNITWGESTDTPVSGDWNGDGTDDIGVHRSALQKFVLKNGTDKTVVKWGLATDTPVAGDWNGDGMGDIGVFRSSLQKFVLKNGTDKTVVKWGLATDTPVSGDWNGDGLWDAGVFRSADQRFILKNGTEKTIITFGQSTDIPVSGDWNNDGLWDIGVFRPSLQKFILKNGTETMKITFGQSTDLPVTGKW